MNIKKIFNKKKTGVYNVLSDNYVPASLPSCGQGHENFVPSGYPMNNPEAIETAYHDTEVQLNEVIKTCDIHSTGYECDNYIEAQIKHIIAGHKDAIANNKNQIARILAARKMRKDELERNISPLKEEIENLQSEIEPLEDLRSQFQIHIGKSAISVGLLITLVSGIIDAAVNFSFLQNFLLSNPVLLVITVICMSVMSDGSMYALGTFLSRREEKFTSKPLFWTTCIGLAGMFLLSVVASVMVRFGSMGTTYGTINSAGEFVGKESFTLAEYGVTLVTSFVTTATGLLSFGFSLDKNAFSVSVRERKKKELAECLARLDSLENEKTLIENAPDPKEWDELKRTAAEYQIEAIRLGLKFHCRKLLTVRLNDADFTEKMAESGAALLREASHTDNSETPAAITLNKVS